MKVGIHTLHISKDNLLPQNHLVKRSNEECIQETSVENGQSNDTSNKLKVVEMLRVDARVRVDLKSIVVVRRVLKQAVERIEHLVRKQEKEFSRQSSIVQTILSVKLDHQPLLEILGCLPHHFGVRVLENVISANLDVALSGKNPERWLRSEVNELASKVTLVLRHILIQ